MVYYCQGLLENEQTPAVSLKELQDGEQTFHWRCCTA